MSVGFTHGMLNYFDEDNDGALSAKEMTNLINASYPDLTPEQIII